MADPQTNPFASYSPEDQASIRQQLVSLSSSGQLNEAQKRSVALALTSLGSASGFPSQTLPDKPPPEPPSMWDKANTGLVSPDTILKLANLPVSAAHAVLPNVPKPPTMADLAKLAQGNPADSPTVNALTVGITGATADTASAMSGFTSPLSLGTMGLAKVAAGTGAASKIAKAILTATGIGFGGKGVLDTAEGVSKGVDTPEGAQQTLGGMAQVAGAAPAVGEIGAAMRGAAQHMVPQAFAEGENALVRTLQPDKKLVPALRDAYRTVAPQLANAPVKDLPDLEAFADIKREQAAQELTQRLQAISPDAGTVSMKAAARNIRGKITEAMKLGAPTVGAREPGPDVASPILDDTGSPIMRPGDPGSLGKPGAEVKVIADYAERVANGKPLSLVDAERIVKQLNARTMQFDKLPPEAQRAMLANGDPILAEKGLKESLQDQIEQRMGNYRDLKAQYGSWKEIQNQTNAQMDRQAKKDPTATWLQRRGMESVLGLLGTGAGTAIGMTHGGGNGAIGGSILGYMASKAAAEMYLNKLASPERMLQRAVNPPTRSPIPFMGQVVQPVASSVAGGGGSAF